MKIDPDDPKLTAYALGELDEKETAEFEAELAVSSELREEVAAIHATAQQLTEELQNEPYPTLAEKQRLRVKRQIEGAPPESRTKRSRIFWRWLLHPVTALVAIVVGAGVVALMSSPNFLEAQTRAKAARDKAEARNMAVRLATYHVDFNSFNGSGSADPNTWHGYSTPSGYMIDSFELEKAGKSADNLAAFGHDIAFNTEAYDRVVDNSFLLVTQNPLSTFSIDVDTASYSNVRRFINQGRLPSKDAVRIEELLNYFSYDYPEPTGRHPFSVFVEVNECPWKPEHRLVRIGLKGKEIDVGERPNSNLVFLLDVSGSMRPENKLPLLRRAMRLLVNQLTPSDRVAIVVYAGASGLVLPSTSCNDKEAILDALDRLEAGGSTNGGAGIQLAYRLAQENFIPRGVNRVILATDGDFNVGVTNQGDLTRLIEEKAKGGVFLSVLGFGMGNYKDSNLEKLADQGNGNYAYIDTLNEARKVLVEQMSGTLVTIAKDVKIQIEFNPARVGAYRLIGYENRLLRAEDFNDDAKDAGEIGAGHTVTALYEIVPAGVEIDVPDVDPLKYQVTLQLPDATEGEEMLTVKLRYKSPQEDTSRLLEEAVRDDGDVLSEATDDFQFAAAVASFGMLLRDSPYKGESTFDRALELAREGKGADPYGYRAEFLQLAGLAKALKEN